MKNIISAALIIVLCSIAACTEQKTERYKQLETVDMLSRYDKYDSAKIIIDSICIEQLTEGEKALYNILTLRLYNILNYQTTLDSMLDCSEKYFKSTNDSTHLAEVYIHKGGGCYMYKKDYDSSAYYIEIGKKLADQEEPDHYLLSQIYWYQILIHALSGEYQKMLQDAEQQTYHAEKSGNKRQVAYAALNTVTALRYANEPDKLDLPLQAALNWSKYLQPQDIVYIYNIYAELAMDDKPETAKENLDKALAIQPDSKITRENLARLYLKQGKIKEAEAICSQCSDINWSEDKVNVLTILADCKIASNNLTEAIKIQKNIISEKDSIIKRINNHKPKNAILSSTPNETKETKETKETNNTLIMRVLICVFAISTIFFAVLFIIQKQKTKALETKVHDNNPHPQEKTFIEILEGKDNMSQWNKKMQLDFIDYCRDLHPEILNQIETEYQTLTPTLMIFQILSKLKDPKEIQNIMGITESSYYSNISRIKTKKITLE